MKNVVFFITLFLFFQSCQSNFDIAKELYDQGEYREAINNYLIALESDSRKGIIYNDISTCYINLKIYDSALYFIDNALELDSLSNLSYHNRGRYHDEPREPPI